MRKLLAAFTAICVAAFSLPVTAGVVYNWEELEGHPLLGGPIVARIVVKDEVWKTGSASYDYFAANPQPASGLGLLDFYVDSPAMERVALRIVPCQELSFDPGESCQSHGFSLDEPIVAGPYEFHFDLQFGGVLSGHFAAGSSLDYASFSGNPISTGFAGNEDLAGNPCAFDLCPTRGVFVLDVTTIPVPEPSTAWMLLVGLAVLLTIVRRRCDSL